MSLPFKLDLNPWNREVVMVTECEGSFVIEPMRFITLGEARRQGRQAAERRDQQETLRGLGKKSRRAA